MVNKEILSALQSALARGESLKKAMMTLFNAGYKKEEISEAAKSINSPTPPSKQPKVKQASQQPASTSKTSKSQTSQRVSGYGQPPKPIGKIIIILLGFLLLILIGILVTIFLFKDELIDFFNNIFN